MSTHRLTEAVEQLAVPDWNRRLFDALVPIPDGTSYNAYVVRGSEKTVLVDTADPSKASELAEMLAGLTRLDHVVSLHAEQDHSGLIPMVLERYPSATVVTSPKAKGMLVDLLGLDAERIRTVADGEKLALGGRSLEFVHTPWVHWPETMCAFIPEDRLLLSCDLFGSHLATSGPDASDPPRVYEAAKRYFATIMMPFGKFIEKNLRTLEKYDIATIAPSHGPIHRTPATIVDAYQSWVSGPLADRVVIAYESMHESTAAMVRVLGNALARRGIGVELFELTTTDVGRLAMALVDATTLVLGTPTVAGGPHPNVLHAAYLVSTLRPRTRWLSVIGSAGWSAAKTVKMLTEVVASMPAQPLEGVFASGLPKAADRQALDALAETIAAKHVEAGVRAAAG